MYGKWLLSERYTKFLMAGTLAIFLVAEAVVIVASLGLRNERPPLGLVSLLTIVFINSLPGIMGISAHQRFKRLKSKNFDVIGEEWSLPFLSRQYLRAAVAAYAAIIMDVIFLTEAARPK
jgi:hypothetical protein